MDGLLITLQKVLVSVPFFAIIALMLFVGKKFFDLTTTYNFQEELTKKDNPAFGVAISGFVLGLAIALGGTTYGVGGQSAVDAFVSLAVYGLLTIVLILHSQRDHRGQELRHGIRRGRELCRHRFHDFGRADGRVDLIHRGHRRSPRVLVSWPGAVGFRWLAVSEDHAIRCAPNHRA